MAQKTNWIKSKDLYKLRLITSNQISPDGERVIYSLEGVDKKTEKQYSNLWVIPTIGDIGKQFTFGEHCDIKPKWSPCGTKVAFLSNRLDEDQDQLFIISLGGGEAYPVTDLQGDFAEFNWSLDGKKIVFQFRKMDKEALIRMKDEEKKKLGIVSRRITRIRYKEDGEGFMPKERWRLWVLDVKKQKARQLTAHEIFDDEFPVWSPDGYKVAFLSNRSEDPDLDIDSSDIYIFNLKDKSILNLNTPPGRKGFLSYSPDGKQIAYIGIDGWGKWWKNFSLFVVSADGGGDVEDLLSDKDLYVDADTCSDTLEYSPTPPVWSADGSQLFFQVVEAGNVVLKAVTLESKHVRDVIAEKGIVGDFSFDKSTTKLAYCEATLDYPSDIKFIDLESDSIHRLTRINKDWLEKITLGEVDTVWFKGFDENDLQGWLLRPPNFDPEKQYPAILWIHGGPISMFANQFSHEYQLFAQKGYISFYANPRGGTGYGQAHTQAIWDNWGDKDYQDLMAWTDYVAALPYIDENRLGVTGGSYGGYLTAWIIGHTDRFKAAIASAMYNNLISGWGSSDYNWGTQIEYNNKPPWEDFNNLWRQSPMKYIGNAKTPTMIMHGEEDMRDALEQSEQIYVALKYLGVDSELILYPDEAHGISRTDRKIKRLKHMLSWFDKYLK